MDHMFGCSGFTLNFSNSNAFESGSAVISAADNPRTISRRIDSLTKSSLYNLLSKGTKRKWVDFHGDGVRSTSLSLGLGNSSSSSDSSKQSMATGCTISSTKETDDGSSIDLGLNFQFNLGNEGTTRLDKRTCDSKRALEKKPGVDLQLTLSVGPSESVVTDADLTATTQHHNIFLQSCNMVSVPAVDEGSTSARWKCGGKLFSYLSEVEKNTGFSCMQVFPGSSNQPQGSVQMPTLVQLPKSPVACTSRVAHPQQRNNSTKTCLHPGCVKGARGSSGRCIAHGGGRRCQKEDCNKGAEGKTIFCKAHGGGRRCEHLGCTKSAEGRTDFCIAHGGGRRCSHEGCKKAARGKSGLCIKHGGGKRCQMENCTKSAEGQSGLCIAHGGGRRCKYEGCTKGAQGSTNFCKAHGGGKRCTYLNCTKGAEGSTPFCKGHGGGKRCSTEGCPKSVHGGTQFCVAHGGGKRCAVQGCTRSARGRTDSCVRHGGGKRCQFASCDKSAQGSTDFCKAHGGGKRCLWGQPGSEVGSGAPPCDRFARGKKGVCAAHNALLEDGRVHGGQILGAVHAVSTVITQGDPPGNTENGGANIFNWSGFDNSSAMHPVETLRLAPASIPEGRVHGGNFLALFANDMSFGNQPRKHAEGSTSTPRKWL